MSTPPPPPPLHAFVRTGLPRLVQAGEAAQWVRPPTVEEALQVLALMPSALAAGTVEAAGNEDVAEGDQEVDAMLLRRVLTPWLGLRLSAFVLSPSQPIEARIGLMRHLLGEGVPEARGSGDDDEPPPPQPIERVRWDLLVLDVARVFHWTLADVLQMEWPRFMLICARMDATEARAMMRQVPLFVLPHARDADGLLDAMRKRAAGAVMVEKDAEIEEMEARVGRAWSRAHFGPPARREEAMKEFVKLEKELARMKRQRGL